MRSRRVRKQNMTVLTMSLIIAAAVIGCALFGTTKAQAAPAETSYKYYTSIQIQKGDTLWNIANEYMSEEYASVNDYIEEVCEINHISDDDIHSGQYLTVPYYSNDYLE